MSAWTEDELRRIGAAQELEIAPVAPQRRAAHRDADLGRTRWRRTLRARGIRPGTGWYRVARTSGAGRIQAGGVEKDVTIEYAEDAVYDEVDAAYRDKYGRYASIVDSITDDRAPRHDAPGSRPR